MASISPLTVVSWNEFVADPTLMYNLFTRNNSTGNFQFDPTRVNVMAGSKSRTIKVETLEELAAWEHDLLSKPILLDVTTVHSKTDNYVYVRVTTRWRGHFAVLLNPLNPAVRGLMADQFQKAKDLMAEGKKFCLEFDLGPCIENWYAEMLDGAQGCYTSTKSALTRFYVTNKSKYQHCFDCNALWCSICLPCWLFSAPFYMIHRACTVSDEVLTFNLPIIMRTPLARNLVVELIPERDQRRVEANRQLVSNRAVRDQQVGVPQVYAPERMGHPNMGPHRPPTGAPMAPPPYSPSAGAVVQQPPQFGQGPRPPMGQMPHPPMGQMPHPPMGQAPPQYQPPAAAPSVPKIDPPPNA